MSKVITKHLCISRSSFYKKVSRVILTTAILGIFVVQMRFQSHCYL